MSDKKTSKDTSDAALKARLVQLEIENRLRLQNQSLQGEAPFKDTPRRGFGSAQGIAHLRHTEYQRRGPNPPAPPPAIPEPGKARFGGTYLRTPLPGILLPDGGELIEPIPAAPIPAQAKPGAAAARGDAFTPPPSAPATVSGETAPAHSQVPKEEPQAKPPAALPKPSALPTPSTSQKIVGGGAMRKAPLPALYHAGMKAAEDAEKAKRDELPSAPPIPEAKAKAEDVIAIPESAEVTKDGPKVPRAKRFKNPSLAPKSPS